MLNLQEQHEGILYPVVRVRTDKTGGSGTIIYSDGNPITPGEYQSFIMTCAHVIDSAITLKKEWDALLKREVKKEFCEQVDVEVFDYVYQSRVNSANRYKADIIAYDKAHDIAILKLDSPKKMDYVAKLIPRDKIKDVKLFTPIWASGCSLGHEPFANPGFVTFLSEMIDNKLYWMGNCNSIFGNSGGAIFLAETGEQIGITARVTGIQLGFGMDIMTWMGFFVAPQRLYEFFDEQELKFLYDPKDTYEKAIERRKKKAEQARLMQVTKEESGEEEEEDK